jgi:hypothetical protein
MRRSARLRSVAGAPGSSSARTSAMRPRISAPPTPSRSSVAVASSASWTSARSAVAGPSSPAPRPEASRAAMRALLTAWLAASLASDGPPEWTQRGLPRVGSLAPGADRPASVRARSDISRESDRSLGRVAPQRVEPQGLLLGRDRRRRGRSAAGPSGSGSRTAVHDGRAGAPRRAGRAPTPRAAIASPRRLREDQHVLEQHAPVHHPPPALFTQRRQAAIEAVGAGPGEDPGDPVGAGPAHASQPAPRGTASPPRLSISSMSRRWNPSRRARSGDRVVVPRQARQDGADQPLRQDRRPAGPAAPRLLEDRRAGAARGHSGSRGAGRRGPARPPAARRRASAIIAFLVEANRSPRNRRRPAAGSPGTAVGEPLAASHGTRSRAARSRWRPPRRPRRDQELRHIRSSVGCGRRAEPPADARIQAGGRIERVGDHLEEGRREPEVRQSRGASADGPRRCARRNSCGRGPGRTRGERAAARGVQGSATTPRGAQWNRAASSPSASRGATGKGASGPSAR